MSRRHRVIIATLVMISILGSACGLDDGARVRNQDNVRESHSSQSQ